MIKKFNQFLFILLANGIFSFDVAAQTGGEQLYVQNCLICHADDGAGAMPGIAGLAENRNWSKISEDELLAKIKQGIVSPGAAIAMPPKGGNPDLTDSDIRKILKYIRMEFLK